MRGPLVIVMLLAATNAPAQHPRRVVRLAERAADRSAAAPLWRRWVAESRDPASPARARLARLGLATLARLTYDYRAADSLYASLLAPPSAGDVAAWARLGLGISLAQRWRSAEADLALTRADSQAAVLGDRAARVEALSRLALLRGRTAGVAAGLGLVDRAESLVSATDTVGRATIMATRAQLLLARGDSGAARLADATRRLARAAGLRRHEGLALQLLAREQIRLGAPDSAIALYGTSASLLARVNERVGWAVALQWRGFLLRTRGDLGAARRDLEEALGAGPMAGALTLGWVRLNLGEIAFTLGDWRDADEQFARARALLASAGDQWGLAEAMRSDALARRAARDWAGSDSLFEAIERRLETSGNRSDLLDVRVERLRNALSRRDWALARRLLVLARDSVATRASAARIDVDYYEALLALGEGRPGDALRLLATAPAPFGPEAYLRTVRIAEAHARSGDVDDAARWASAALDSLDDWRGRQRTRAARLAAFQVHGDVADPDAGFATIIAALAAGHRADAAFELAERLAARELLGAMMRRDALRIAPADAAEARAVSAAADATDPADAAPVTLRELEDALPAGSALVEYVTGAWGEPTTAIVVTRAAVRTVALATADSLLGALDRFRASLAAGVRPRALARRLGDALLAPVADALPSDVTRLTIVGGTVLQSVPFDALELRDGRAAVERFEIALAPSASVAMLLARRGERGSATSGAVLALGASARPRGTGHAAWDSLPPLPGAAREAERVAALFTRGEARTGARATESALESAHTASVVHIAAHAIVDPSAMGETALLLAGSAHDDGVLRPQEIARLSLAADLVVLSACRTTRSDVRFGDEGFRGLVTPLFEAGARSVVATAWPVDDARQLALVERFYGELARGLTVGSALRAARLASMRAGDSPREWAALVLWGDAAVHPAARMRSRASSR